MSVRLASRLAGVAGLALAALPFAAQPGAADTALPRAEVEAIVKEYLLANPEVIAEAMQALEKKQAAEAAAEQARVIQKSGSILFDSTRQVVLGNPKGDVTIVEFFDYNCGYCKRAMADMIGLVERDPQLRVVLKEFPVLGPGSTEAAKVAVAVNRIAPEKYLDFHRKLMSTRGQIDGAKATEAATSVGIAAAALEKAMADKEVAATLEEVYGLASLLGVTGTPSWVIGNEVVAGAIGIPKLQARIADARCTTTKKC